MSEDNEKDIFSKRKNQFSEIKEESIEDEGFELEDDEINENLIENVIEEDYNINELEDMDSTDEVEYEDTNSYDIETDELIDEKYDNYSENEETSQEVQENDFEENPKSLLEQFVLNADSNDLDEDIPESLVDEKISNERDFIDIADETNNDSDIGNNIIKLNNMELEDSETEIEEDEPEDLMDDLLADADELLREHKEIINDELNDFDESEEIEDFDNNYEEEEEDDEVSYSQEEIEASRKTKKTFDKELKIKIGVGVVFIIVIIIAAIFVRKLINGDNKPSNIKINETTVNENPNSEIKKPSENVTIIDDILDDLEEETNEAIEETETETETDLETVVTDSEASLFIQTFKGHIVDINETKVYVSDLTYDKSLEIEQDFNEYKESMVDVDENQIKLSYDYSLNDKLSTIIYKEFSILDLSDIPEWATIGSEVSVVYMQNKESLLNELIEIEKYEKVDNATGTIINPTETESSEEEVTDEAESLVGENVWGENWNTIVTKINDRRKKDEALTDKDGNILDLDNLELKESVTANIKIGTASIVWFKIGWKTNKDVKDVPNVEDVTVELQTSNGTLVNDSNIKRYGKQWTAEDKTINFVIKNTRAGDWGVVFTKDVGTYLGDVTIQAIPITGFLQIVDASAVYTDGKLKVIWNAGGVKDDNCRVQVYAKNGSKEVLMYSANSIDDGIHTIDMVEIDATKIAGNTYDIIIKVTDIDATASTPKAIAATYITDIKTIEGIEIPALK